MRTFTATLDAVSSNKTKTTVKLSMSNSAARKFAAQYLNSLDKEILVSFDDPQMEMDVKSDRAGRPGLTVQTDASGVVESVKSDEEGEQEEMTLEDDTFEDVDFGNEGDGGEKEEGAADPEDVDDEDDAEPVDKEELEAFILEKRPEFKGIGFDFPALLERNRQGETFAAMAREMKVPSAKLQAAWSQYKRRATVLLKNNA